MLLPTLDPTRAGTLAKGGPDRQGPAWSSVPPSLFTFVQTWVSVPLYIPLKVPPTKAGGHSYRRRQSPSPGSLVTTVGPTRRVRCGGRRLPPEPETWLFWSGSPSPGLGAGPGWVALTAGTGAWWPTPDNPRGRQHDGRRASNPASWAQVGAGHPHRSPLPTPTGVRDSP